MKKPNLIEIEGTDFCGKSTQTKLLSSKLNIPVARMPGFSDIGEKVREIIKYDSSVRGMTQLGLGVAAHYSAYTKMINEFPGQSFIIDRGLLSFYVYQGCLENLKNTNSEAFNSIMIDLDNFLLKHFNYTRFYLNISLDELLTRKNSSKRESEKIDQYDNLDNQQFQTMIDYYKESVSDSNKVFNLDKTYIINGENSVETINNRIIEVL